MKGAGKRVFRNKKLVSMQSITGDRLTRRVLGGV